MSAPSFIANFDDLISDFYGALLNRDPHEGPVLNYSILVFQTVGTKGRA
jgi:hypothetical protein